MMALLEQNPSAHVELTVRDVVQLGRIPHLGRWRMGNLSRRQGHDDDVVEKAMATTGVSELTDRAWSSLSGGERQRVQLARALAQEPEILFLDEPTNHLDLPHQIDLLERVRGLGLTTVTVIHDLDLAAAYADDLIVLDSGRMVAGGPASTVLTPDLVRDHFGVDTKVVTDKVRRQHCARRSASNHATRVEHDEVVGVGGSQVEVMNDSDRRQAESSDPLQEVDLVWQVKVICRLVKE